MMLSVSALSAYLYCPRKLFLERILKLKEPPKESLVLGTIRHDIFDQINKTEENLVRAIDSHKEIGEIFQVYKKHYSNIARSCILKQTADLRTFSLSPVDVFKQTWPSLLNEVQNRATNVHSFMSKNEVYGKELWEMLTPKFVSELNVQSKNLNLRGIVDKVEIYETGYVPVELKTGKMPKEGMWPGHRIQIAAYALLLEEHYNQEIKEGFVHYLDSGEKRHLAINPFIKDEIRKLIAEVTELLERKEVPEYCENKNKCEKCGVKEKCYDPDHLNGLIAEITAK